MILTLRKQENMKAQGLGCNVDEVNLSGTEAAHLWSHKCVMMGNWNFLRTNPTICCQHIFLSWQYCHVPRIQEERFHCNSRKLMELFWIFSVVADPCVCIPGIGVSINLLLRTESGVRFGANTLLYYSTFLRNIHPFDNISLFSRIKSSTRAIWFLPHVEFAHPPRAWSLFFLSAGLLSFTTLADPLIELISTHALRYVHIGRYFQTSRS